MNFKEATRMAKIYFSMASENWNGTEDEKNERTRRIELEWLKKSCTQNHVYDVRLTPQQRRKVTLENERPEFLLLTFFFRISAYTAHASTVTACNKNQPGHDNAVAIAEK
jgi:hypothetical protein